MATDVMGPVQALREGWSILIRNLVVVLGGFLVFLSLVVVCAMIPYAKWGLLPTIPFALLGGLHILLLNAARDTNPRLTDLFSGFRQSEKWLAAGWALAGVYSAFLVSCLFVFGSVSVLLVQSLSPSCPTSLMVACFWEGLRICGVLLWPSSGLMLILLLAFALSIGYGFTLFAAADGASFRQSTARSRELARGRHGKVLRTLLPLGLICLGPLLMIGSAALQTNANAFGWLGWVAYAVGLAVAAGVALCAVTVTYVRLDQRTPRLQDNQITSAAA